MLFVQVLLTDLSQMKAQSNTIKEQ